MKKFIAFASKINHRKQITHTNVENLLVTLTEYRFYDKAEELTHKERGEIISRFHFTGEAFVALYSVEEKEGKIVATLIQSIKYRASIVTKYYTLNETEVEIVNSGASVYDICVSKLEESIFNVTETFAKINWKTLPCYVARYNILVYIPCDDVFIPVYSRFYDVAVYETFVSDTTYSIQVTPSYYVAQEVTPLNK